MHILQTRRFQNTIKKFHANQKISLDASVKKIVANPAIGEEKVGDLAGIRIYKFYMVNQLTLLAYSHSEVTNSLTLLAIGSHENFYRDLK